MKTPHKCAPALSTQISGILNPVHGVRDQQGEQGGTEACGTCIPNRTCRICNPEQNWTSARMQNLLHSKTKSVYAIKNSDTEITRPMQTFHSLKIGVHPQMKSVPNARSAPCKRDHSNISSKLACSSNILLLHAWLHLLPAFCLVQSGKALSR